MSDESLNAWLLVAGIVAGVILLLVETILLFYAVGILRNIIKTLKSINIARCSCEDSQAFILTKLESIEKSIGDVQHINSIMSPILRRKVEYNGKTVDAKADETQTFPQEVTQ